MTRVVAVRHGETDWNREGRLQGWAPVPLNDTGREQAAAAGAWLADEYDVDRVFGSDSLRTRQTAEAILESFGDLPAEYERHWRERHLGIYQGLTYADVEERFPRFGLGESAHEAALAVPESGESLRDVADRVTDRFAEVVDEHAGETLLVVTHGGPLHVLLGYAKGLSLQDALGTHHQSNCGVNEFRADGDDVEVVRGNVTEWRD
ncbi:histidine phosphatase family protein [Natronomonas salina]|uniref:histidine phosphatase family protein n=1 Tax=Natronomonas salina TaxID=1710540 RepID=UPI0015B67EA2|nr:histidine phosphatase family protein [Natronomonas salina]QLD89899.1 histidine phosphatase family protein [Natronomonas salina]